MQETITQSSFNQYGIELIKIAFEHIENSKRDVANKFAYDMFTEWQFVTDFTKEAAILEKQWEKCSFNLAAIPSLNEFFAAVKDSLTTEQKTTWKNGFYNMILRAFFKETGLQNDFEGELDARGFASKPKDVNVKQSPIKQEALKSRDKSQLSLDAPPNNTPNNQDTRQIALLKSALAIIASPRKVQGQTTTNASIIEMAIMAYAPLDAGAKNELVNAFRGMCEAMPSIAKAA